MFVNEQFPVQHYQRADFVVSTDAARLDLDTIYHFLANEAYWSSGVKREQVVRAVEHSLCFGVYRASEQVGFARVITDFTTLAHVADVFIRAPFRGQGLGKWLVACMLQHPALQHVRKWSLNTRDAHTLYRRYGFQNEPQPENYLIYRPSVPE